MLPEEKFYTETGLTLPQAEQSQMFGKPCFKINGKAFVCFFENEMVFKLDSATNKEAVSLDGTKFFDPSGKGRAMKEWVQVPFEYKSKWKQFAEKAMKYVDSSKK